MKTKVTLHDVAALDQRVKDLKAAAMRRGWGREYEQYTAIRAERRERKQPPANIRVQMRQRIVARLREIAGALPEQGYSMGSCYSVRVGKLVGSVSTAQEYARGSKWRAKHGSVSLRLTAAELRRIRVVGGVVTLFSGQLEKGCERVRWINATGRKQHYALEWVSGWMYKGVHLTTLESVREQKKAINARIRERKRAERGRKRVEKAYRAMKAEQSRLRKLALRCFYGPEHSYSAGNCRVGTLNFARNIGMDLSRVGGIRGDELMRLAEKYHVADYAESLIAARMQQLAHSGA